jgi:hypothetical protein
MMRGDRVTLLLDQKHAARQAEVASQSARGRAAAVVSRCSMPPTPPASFGNGRGISWLAHS